MGKVNLFATTLSEEPRVPRYGLKKVAFRAVPGARVPDQAVPVPECLQLENLAVVSGPNETTRVYVRLRVGEEVREATAYGDRAVNAAYEAVEYLTCMPVKVEDSSVRSVTVGPEVMSEAMVRVYNDDYPVVGYATYPDEVTASVLAYVNVLNQVAEERRSAARRVRELGPI